MSFDSQKKKIDKLLEKDSLTNEELKQAKKMIRSLKPTNYEEDLKKSWLSEALYLHDMPEAATPPNANL